MLIGSWYRLGKMSVVDRQHEDATARATNGRRPHRAEKLEALAAAVRRWLDDPRYVTEQLMIEALKKLEE